MVPGGISKSKVPKDALMLMCKTAELNLSSMTWHSQHDMAILAESALAASIVTSSTDKDTQQNFTVELLAVGAGDKSDAVYLRAALNSRDLRRNVINMLLATILPYQHPRH
eukprot:2814081-Amphidinium_carterae.1